MAQHVNLSQLFRTQRTANVMPRMDLPEDAAGHWWTASGQGERACANCVGSTTLERVVFNHVPESKCSMCDEAASWAAPIDTLFEYVYTKLLSEYQDPNLASLPVDPDTGTYLDMVDTYSTDDLLYDIGERFTSDALVARLEKDIGHDWVSKDGVADSPDQRMIASWGSFKRRLEVGPRFLFDREVSTFPEASYSGFEDFLSMVAAHVQQQLVREQPAGLVLHRARLSDGEVYVTADDLGSPPAVATGAQRLSPAGTPCFYASEDRDTATGEVRPAAESTVSYGEWTTTRPLIVVDFAADISVPSLFDPVAGHLGVHYRFVRDFGVEISRPTAQGHVDANGYLATQIIAEFFRYELSNAYKQGVDAIRYRSSLSPGGCANWCIFGAVDRTTPASVQLTVPS